MWTYCADKKRRCSLMALRHPLTCCTKTLISGCARIRTLDPLIQESAAARDTLRWARTLVFAYARPGSHAARENTRGPDAWPPPAGNRAPVRPYPRYLLG